MRVELDVFSGRANPQWELDEGTSATLLRMQGRLARSTQPPVAPPSLGYRGFVYAARGGPIRAYRGFLTRGTVSLGDPNRSVERFLMEQLPKEFEPLRDRVARELSAGEQGT